MFTNSTKGKFEDNFNLISKFTAGDLGTVYDAVNKETNEKFTIKIT